MRKHLQKGMTLLELLIVVAIIAIIAAIATANYLGALTRAKQKRTVADIRIIASAWEARASDTHSYQVAGYTFAGAQVPYTALHAALAPTYARALPQYDGWSRPLEFNVTSGSSADEGSYLIRSAGRDGAYDTSTAPGATNDPDCDIVFSDGSFLVYPEVAQTN
jgi:general secretion pathway protein G